MIKAEKHLVQEDHESEISKWLKLENEPLSGGSVSGVNGSSSSISSNANIVVVSNSSSSSITNSSTPTGVSTSTSSTSGMNRTFGTMAESATGCCSSGTTSSPLHIPFGTVSSTISPSSISATSAVTASSVPQISLTNLTPNYGNTNGYYYMNGSMPCYNGSMGYNNTYSTQYAGLNNTSSHSASISHHHHAHHTHTPPPTVSPTAVFPTHFNSQLQYNSSGYGANNTVLNQYHYSPQSSSPPSTSTPLHHSSPSPYSSQSSMYNNSGYNTSGYSYGYANTNTSTSTSNSSNNMSMQMNPSQYNLSNFTHSSNNTNAFSSPAYSLFTASQMMGQNAFTFTTSPNGPVQQLPAAQVYQLFQQFLKNQVEEVVEDKKRKQSSRPFSRRVRQTRPKVVEAKGAVQCKGRNRKKGTQCRNAALMEYIGPRPVFCAEHIELDPKTLYCKCRSSYQKEPGDNKGCKEVVLKEFGLCYKHYGDLINEIVHSRDYEKAHKHYTRITELLAQLEKEAAMAKKKDGDLYQRKNKLIPKFQEMKRIATKAVDALETCRSKDELSPEDLCSSFTDADSVLSLNVSMESLSSEEEDLELQLPSPQQLSDEDDMIEQLSS